MTEKKEEFSWQYSLKRNTINIFEPITAETAERVISQLQYLDEKFHTDEVPMDGLAIYDTMNYIDAKIATVGLGMPSGVSAPTSVRSSLHMQISFSCRRKRRSGSLRCRRRRRFRRSKASANTINIFA